MKYDPSVRPMLADLHPTAVPTKTHAYSGVLTWRSTIEYERLTNWWKTLSPEQRAFRKAREGAVNNLIAVYSFEVCLWDIYNRVNSGAGTASKGWLVHRPSAQYDRDHVICVPKDASLAYWMKACTWLEHYS